MNTAPRPTGSIFRSVPQIPKQTVGFLNLGIGVSPFQNPDLAEKGPRGVLGGWGEFPYANIKTRIMM